MSKLPIPVDPPGWPRPRGYANAMMGQGKIVAVAGQVGWEPSTGRFASDDLVEQSRQALTNVLEVLRAAGAGTHEIVRLTWFITDREEYLRKQKELGEAYRTVMGKHFPAMSVIVVAGLVDERAKVEIEATAVLP